MALNQRNINMEQETRKLREALRQRKVAEQKARVSIERLNDSLETKKRVEGVNTPQDAPSKDN